MEVHLPYSQRQKHPPVYIGFEMPRAYRPGWLGLVPPG